MSKLSKPQISVIMSITAITLLCAIFIASCIYLFTLVYSPSGTNTPDPYPIREVRSENAISLTADFSTPQPDPGSLAQQISNNFGCLLPIGPEAYMQLTTDSNTTAQSYFESFGIKFYGDPVEPGWYQCTLPTGWFTEYRNLQNYPNIDLVDFYNEQECRVFRLLLDDTNRRADIIVVV